LGVRVDEVKTERNRKMEQNNLPISYSSSDQSGGDEFRSERMTVVRKKKATRFVKMKKKHRVFFL
jgi:hypothetical protein